MSWVRRLVDARVSFLRLVLLDLSGLGYLLLGPHVGGDPTRPQWVLAVAAFVAVLALYRFPVVSVVVQTVLLAVALWFLDDATINQVGTSWMLLELSMWAPRLRIVWLCGGLVAAVYAAFSFGEPGEQLLPLVF